MPAFSSFPRSSRLRIPGQRLLALLLVTFLLPSCGGGDGASGTRLAPSGVAAAPVSGIALLAGGLGGPGNADGSGTSSRFSQPSAVAMDASGNLYVSDTGNHTIRKITPAGVVSTLAGAPGVPGTLDGTGGAARFNKPLGIALDAAGNLYVADSGNYTVRVITPGGVVTTLAGHATVAGSADGTGTNALFGSPTGVAVDTSGNVYVTEVSQDTVRKVTPGGVVTTLAGSATLAGSSDGTGPAARFSAPRGITFGGDGNLYVADSGNHLVRVLTPAGVVTTLATTPFNTPTGVVRDGSGNIYVSDAADQTVNRIDSGNNVTVVAGMTQTPGAVDANGGAARFFTPQGIAIDASGVIYVADTGNYAVRAISTSGDVTTFAGLAQAAGTTDASGALARFTVPYGLAVDASGNIDVADSANHTLRAITPAGATSTLAGLAGSAGARDGALSVATFRNPHQFVMDNAGNYFVVDTGNHAIRRIDTSGVVSTFAGSAGVSGSTDGTGTAARFNFPAGIAIDAVGNLYVTDSANHTIRMITPAAVVTTLAGTAGSSGTIDATGSAARFNGPKGVALDLAGNVYVTDSMNDTVRKVTPDGVVTTLAGTAGTAGAVDANGTAAQFSNPDGISVDADGNVYVADTGNHVVRKITPAGDVSTLAGVAGAAGVVTGALPGGLNAPRGLAIGNDGSLYASSENAVVQITLPTPVNRFGVSLRQSATTVRLGQSVTLSWYAPDAVSCQASGDWSGSKAVSGSEAITPVAAGATSYTLTCTKTGGAATTSATVSLTTLPPVPVVSISASPDHIVPGDSVTLTWSSTDATSCTASDAWSGSKATSGSTTVTPPAGLDFYTLTCTGPGGSGVGKATVTATYPAPTMSFSASSLVISQGQSSTLSWSSTNTTGCTASGAWSGAMATAGTLSVTPAAGNQTYNLSCSGAGGVAHQSVTITVQAAAASGGGGGGGAGDAGMLAGLGALLLLRRRTRAAA